VVEQEQPLVLWTEHRRGRTLRALLKDGPERESTDLVFALDDVALVKRRFGVHETGAIFEAADHMRSVMEAKGWTPDDEDS
jgi:hypothetical protein